MEFDLLLLEFYVCLLCWIDFEFFVCVCVSFGLFTVLRGSRSGIIGNLEEIIDEILQCTLL